MIAIRKQKDMSQYVLPEDVKRRASGFVRYLRGEETDICTLWGPINDTESITAGCMPAQSTKCYEQEPSKDFPQVDSYRECPIYSCVAAQAKRNSTAYDQPLGDALRTIR